MFLKKLRKTLARHPFMFRAGYVTLLFVFSIMSVTFVALIKMKEYSFTASTNISITPEPFPIGVDPKNETITENPAVSTYLRANFASAAHNDKKLSFLDRISAKLALHDWYQNLASPVSRVLVIEPGERKEQIAKNFGDILKWNNSEQASFLALIASTTPEVSDGKHFPAHYVVTKDAAPHEIALMLIDRFNSEVMARYTNDVERTVPIGDALTIASLLEREAYDFNDMRHISGVIWNRIFIDMPLQIDATLQYAKGSLPYEAWWPHVTPDDKYIDSPFNTYQNKGLPPAPISNPSVEAILATLNPTDTDCMFYFHDSEGGFHCTPTYEEHVTLLQQVYGQGR